MTFFEKRRGWERRRKSDPDLAAARLAELNALEAAYGSRLVPIDGPVAAEWARLLGAKDKNQRDRALAATARVHGFVLVTRNIDDMRGCDVKVLNPFRPNPVVETV
jgi:predicted nucleic acid-binding protein